MAYEVGPYDSTHLYLQWGGKLPGNEQWSCGLRLYGTTLGAETSATSLLTAATAAVAGYHGDTGVAISPSAKLSFVKLNAIDVNGHYLNAITNESIVADLPGGGGSAPVYPNQVALCVSLTTGFSRGGAHRGRFYLPMPTFGLDANGQFAAANAVAVSNGTDSFISGLNAMSTGWKVAVFSRKSGAPSHRLVTGNQVGRVYDTQRRRRRALVENYQ